MQGRKKNDEDAIVSFAEAIRLDPNYARHTGWGSLPQIGNRLRRKTFKRRRPWTLNWNCQQWKAQLSTARTRALIDRALEWFCFFHVPFTQPLHRRPLAQGLTDSRRRGIMSTRDARHPPLANLYGGFKGRGMGWVNDERTYFGPPDSGSAFRRLHARPH